MYRVSFVGDLFVLTTVVEYEITDDNEDNEESIIGLACDNIDDRYGWDVLDAATVDVEVEEIG
jgi:hypothetical protein